MRKRFYTKALIKDITDRGYKLIGNTYYPPNRAKSIAEVQKKPTKIKSNKTGWIDDSRNAKCLQNVDNFTNLILLETGLVVWSEFHFSVERRYRFDYCIPVDCNGKELKIGIEIDGGIFMKGNSGHSSGTGIKRDQQKASLAASLGWRLLRFEPKELLTNKTLELIKKTISY